MSLVAAIKEPMIPDTKKIIRIVKKGLLVRNLINVPNILAPSKKQQYVKTRVKLT